MLLVQNRANVNAAALKDILQNFTTFPYCALTLNFAILLFPCQTFDHALGMSRNKTQAILSLSIPFMNDFPKLKGRKKSMVTKLALTGNLENPTART